MLLLLFTVDWSSIFYRYIYKYILVAYFIYLFFDVLLQVGIILLRDVKGLVFSVTCLLLIFALLCSQITGFYLPNQP